MKINAAARGRARRIAMQALYQWQMTDNALHVIEAACHVENDMEKVDTEYFSELFHGVAKSKSTIDDLFKPYLVGVRYDQLDPISLAVLRSATYEMRDRVDVPYRVVMNEAINLTKKYGAADSHKFVNGVLDKVAVKLREAEVVEAKSKPPKAKPTKKKKVEVSPSEGEPVDATASTEIVPEEQKPVK